MQTALAYRTNRDLFSNHYLDEHLPETEEWDEVSDEALQEAYDDIMGLWEREKSTISDRNESQLEEKFIRPVFRKLGIPFEVEESTSRTQRRPDYGFFETEDSARRAFERREEGGDFYENSVAVADAKRWGRPLDTRGSGEYERDFENPSYQIHVYLQETPARWAVLTNGKKWRLYYGPTSHRLDSYYEVDLPTVLEKGDLEDFKYFYLLFRHEAFLEDAGGESFLDNVYDESNVFAQELGEDLQDNIYQAIKILSEGFLQYPDNDLDEDDLDLVHDASLIYLYRLIFVLYAEAEGRDLLDTDNEIYEQSYSLNSLKQEVAEEIDSGNSKYRDWQDTLWDRLEELFKLIDQGSKSRGIPEEDLYIPAYNGGLFRTDPDKDDSPEARFLAEHRAGDAYLAKVIELLTRSRNGNDSGKIFVDYSSLDVRHLGSIYEGLLEYKLNVADEPLALDDGEYVGADEKDDVVVQEGEVYLTTDSGERKATGSYYTPEYVVEYIVENTLEPLVEDIRKDLIGYDSFTEGGFAEKFAERVFDLKILDPAMGSGHFLTSAVDYLAREIIDAQEKQAAQQGIETVDEDHDINWARRQVAQRCIYGVDLNPLAVELAKVSLWLRTLAAEQPLAFLDHHLKTGNSLVGSAVDEIEELESESGSDDQNATLADFGIARKGTIEQLMRIYQDFIAIENQDLADVKEMESKYDEFERNKLRQRLEGMLNVHAAERFGLDNLPNDAYKRMAAALETDDEWGEIEQMQWFQDAQRWAAENNYFHWELEYPEVYYGVSGDEKANPGFDAVIGNPPYVRISSLDDGVKEYLSNSFPDIYAGNSDVLYYFMAKSVMELRDGGSTGLIVARYFAEAKYAEGLRKFLSQNTRITEIVDFGNYQAFPGVEVLADIVLLEKDAAQKPYDVDILQLKEDCEEESIEQSLSNNSKDVFLEYSLSSDLFTDDTWNIIESHAADIKKQMEKNGENLTDHFDVVKSMETGLNEALTVDEQTIEEHNLERDLLRKLAKTTSIRRYLLRDIGKYVIWTEVDDISEYPNTKAYLEQYKSDLESRYDIEQRGADWWRISSPRNEALFDSDTERILTPFMSTSNKFALDTSKHFNDGGDLRAIFPKDSTTVDLRFVLAVLNSKAGEFYHKHTAKLKRDGYYEYYSNTLDGFPIPDVSSDRPEIPDSFEQRAVQECDSYISSSKTPERFYHELVENYSEGELEVLLSIMAGKMRKYRKEKSAINLDIFDYLGNYSLENSLSNHPGYQPPSGVSNTIVSSTSEERDGLRVGEARVREKNEKLVVELTARYKPEEPDRYETDQWGYTETDFVPAMEFRELDETEQLLLKEFVPQAVSKADGFAGFREKATKTNSLVDRLEDLTLPVLSDVRSGLERYEKSKEEAEKIESQIQKVDRVIDLLIYELFGLSDEQINKIEEFHQP